MNVLIIIFSFLIGSLIGIWFTCWWFKEFLRKRGIDVKKEIDTYQ